MGMDNVSYVEALGAKIIIGSTNLLKIQLLIRGPYANGASKSSVVCPMISAGLSLVLTFVSAASKFDAQCHSSTPRAIRGTSFAMSEEILSMVLTYMYVPTVGKPHPSLNLNVIWPSLVKNS